MIKGETALDFFLLMFLPKQLINVVNKSNTELLKLELNATNTLEKLKFLGILSIGQVCGHLWCQ